MLQSLPLPTPLVYALAQKRAQQSQPFPIFQNQRREGLFVAQKNGLFSFFLRYVLTFSVICDTMIQTNRSVSLILHHITPIPFFFALGAFRIGLFLF